MTFRQNMPIIQLTIGTSWSVLSYRKSQSSDYAVDQRNLRPGKEMWPSRRFFRRALGVRCQTPTAPSARGIADGLTRKTGHKAFARSLHHRDGNEAVHGPTLLGRPMLGCQPSGLCPSKSSLSSPSNADFSSPPCGRFYFDHRRCMMHFGVRPENGANDS
jgi:hypothetical protein